MRSPQPRGAWANVELGNRTMGSDDFSRYLEKVPGCYFFVGCGNREKGIAGKPHTPDFDLDEDAMKVGLALPAGDV